MLLSWTKAGAGRNAQATSVFVGVFFFSFPARFGV